MRGVKASIWLGWEPREAAAFAVARSSIERRLNLPIPVHGLVLDQLKEAGLFYRPQEMRNGRIWDVISGAPCATEFSISRFLVPHCAWSGLALFLDCDMLVRADLSPLFEQADPSKAVYVVKHKFEPPAGTKMDGQAQLPYLRKGWSSFCLFNCDHPSNAKLTVEMVNTVPGRDLHAFCWLKDAEIGELDVTYNWLAGHSDPSIDPKVCHHTDGSPCLPGYENAPYADEWRAELVRWAA